MAFSRAGTSLLSTATTGIARGAFSARPTTCSVPSSLPLRPLSSSSARSFRTSPLAYQPPPKDTDADSGLGSVASGILDSISSPSVRNSYQQRRPSPPPHSSPGSILSSLHRSPTRSQLTPEELWREVSTPIDSAPPVTPYSTRYVNIDRSTSLESCYKRLSYILNVNQVRREMRTRDRHEKRTKLVHRLSSERHRRRFAEAVKKQVRLTMRLKARGM